jgi:cytidine deaminase
MTDVERERLFNLAGQAAQQAYAPYSGFRVGAAVLTEAGGHHVGCNVENASYGLTICAERAAICAAVAAEGAAARIRAIAVQCSSGATCSPCGACRQVINELGPNATVLYVDGGHVVETPISQLLPSRFTLQIPKAPGR